MANASCLIFRSRLVGSSRYCLLQPQNWNRDTLLKSHFQGSLLPHRLAPLVSLGFRDFCNYISLLAC
ncbi:hypothetical protein HBI24_127350 [Parastagonospora nodorum]|nr:hypothetical protein HBH51_083290 [Parastagonospora nodorum]KAH4054867.1 hypothetical protein HBH49_068320 [Parastagonospora nodorum]KAH4175809.1 hypothetical protein HBH43_067280 [Parastagonospora nodorum]KAH4194897.1 hypothetical protein HBH42_086320 [Parastagonospora nodorum]KAH4231631.1 hypothetical protein HBI06_075640 [Parastagonospora nodorum]